MHSSCSLIHPGFVQKHTQLTLIIQYVLDKDTLVRNHASLTLLRISSMAVLLLLTIPCRTAIFHSMSKIGLDARWLATRGWWIGPGCKTDLFAGKPSELPRNLLLKCHPSQARLKISLVWSAWDSRRRLTWMVMLWDLLWMECPAWIGTLTDEMGWASPSPKLRGGSELRLWLKDKCADAGSEDNLWGMAKGVEWNMGGGSRGWRSGVCNFLRPRNGLALTPHLCFVLQVSNGLSCPHNLSCLPLLCAHCRGPCIVESIHEAILNHVGYRSF